MLDESSNDQFYSRTIIQSIMFLNRCLNEAKRNYWFIKLEIVGIVWIMKKIRHMIESIEISSVVIYIDHSVAVLISRQITLIISNSDKLNLRLIRASQYLSDFNLFVRHKAGKVNVVSNALSRLQADVSLIEKIEILKSLYDHSMTSQSKNLTVEISILYHHVALVKMSNDFKLRLKQAYKNDEYWLKILKMIRSIAENNAENRQRTSSTKTGNKQSISTTKTDRSTSTKEVSQSASTKKINQSVSAEKIDRSIEETDQKKKTEDFSDSRELRFRYKNDLIYFTFEIDSKRLCISQSMKAEIFRQTHDFIHHDDFMKTYDRLRYFVYIRFMTKHLKLYIVHCSKC